MTGSDSDFHRLAVAASLHRFTSISYLLGSVNPFLKDILAYPEIWPLRRSVLEQIG
jgi:hypothetical protein